MGTRRRLLATTLAFACLGSAVADRAPVARADTLVDLGNGDSVTGTFFPANENEVFRFVVPKGAKLSVTAKGKVKKGAKTPQVKLVLRDRNGVDLTALAGVLKPAPNGGKASLKVATSGLHTARLTADVAGDYTFQVKWTHPANPSKQRVTFAAQDEAQDVGFAADTGTVAKFTIAADKNSPSIPRLVKAAMLDQSWTTADFPQPASATVKSHFKTSVKLGGAGGDYILRVRETSAAPGAATVSFVTTPPAVKPRRVSLTKKQTGSSGLDQFAKGGIIGKSGGSIVVDDPALSTPIDGSGIEIPSGALATPTVVVISTANPFDPPGDNGPQGPAVNFGPDGLKFKDVGSDVIVTIPFDPLPFDGDYSSLEIWVKDSKGKTVLVPKVSYVIDAGKGTVDFPVLHFSSYQAFGPKFKRKADLNDDGFDDLVVSANSAESDKGYVLVFFGRADFATAQPAAPSLKISGTTSDFRVGRDVAVGDVNGDGVADLALTSNHVDVTNHRAVLVFFGGTGFSPTTAADASARLDGLGAFGETFGDRLLIADVTGDGQPDLIAGAPSTTIDLFREGAVAVFPGGPGFTSSTTQTASTIVIKGGQDSLSIGISLAAGRVVGGDTAADLVIGAEAGFTGGSGNGKVFLLAGGAALASGAIPAGSTPYVGERLDDRFGAAVAVADVDGDGDDDLLAGAPGYDGDDVFSPRPESGIVYVFRGPSLQGGSAFLADIRLGALLQDGEGRGAEIVIGNFAGAAIRDVAWSAPERDGGSPSNPIADTGGLFFLRGDPRFPTGFQLVTPGQIGEGYGTRLLPAADLNGDGRDDLGVAAPGHDGGAGMIEVFFGQGAGQPTFRVVGGAGDRLGDR